MLFNSYEFYIFLFIIAIIFVGIRKSFITPLLLLSSMFFYGYFKYEYTLILILLSVTNFYLVKNFYHNPDYHKKGILISAIINFGTLLYFKYTNFALENVNLFLEYMDINIPYVNVILPIGISFYVFQNFAYTVDVFKEKEPVCNSLFDYILYISWFPQLIAGPIERPSNLLPQIRNISDNKKEIIKRVPVALILFSEGFLRKTFGDIIGLTSDVYFNNLEHAVTTDAIFGTIAFGFQIYADFSGYTRMAQGISWLFGVKLIDNFNIPYIATSIQDFWHRWHISLSTWIRDYVYFSMGGSKKGEFRTFYNLIVIMFICGLWHGASWNFAIWGLIHGFFLAVERIMNKKGLYEALPIVFKRFWLLSIVFLAWIPFRATNIDETLLAYQGFFQFGLSLPSISFIYSLIGIIILDLYVYKRAILNYEIYDYKNHKIIFSDLFTSVLWLCSCILIYIFNSVFFTTVKENFIYFQF